MVFLIVVQFFGDKNSKNRANGSFFITFAEKIVEIMLIVNIKELVGIEEQGRLLQRGKEMAESGRIKNAFLYVKGKRIAD